MNNLTSLELLHLLVEHTPAAIAICDRDMRYLITSRQWLTDYNLGDQDIIGRSHYEVFPEVPDRWKQIHQRCLAGAVEKCEAELFLRADGTKDWVKWEIYPWRHSCDEIEGIVMVTQVITSIKQTEQALQESSRQIVNILESITDGFFALNNQWQFTYINRQAESLMQKTRQELLGKNFWEEFPELVGSTFYNQYRQAVAEQVAVTFEEFYPPLNAWFERMFEKQVGE